MGGWTTQPEKVTSGRGLRTLFKRYLRRCRETNSFFDLTLEQFNTITKKLCHYCERPPQQRIGHYLYNGIDRRDNNRGYSLDNSVPCCWDCNRMKGAHLTEEEMLEVGRALREFRKRKRE